MFVSACLWQPQPSREQGWWLDILAVILRSLWDMLCQTYVAAVCGNRGSGPFYLAEWWVEVQVKRNRSRYLSSENSGYGEYNEANKKTQCLATSDVRIEWNISWKTCCVLNLVELAYSNLPFEAS
jgi:hypothetical protein